MIVVALVVAAVAAVRGLWSPCGLSMLSSLNPVSEAARGHRFAPTAGWYVFGAVAGGAALGGTCALAAAGVELLPSAGASGSWPWVVALVVALAAAASDSTVLRFALPVHPRQVDERWLGRYRRWIYAGGFGVQIGTGFATYVMSGTVYLTAALAALTASPRQALAVGLVFGTVRGLGILFVAPVRDAARLRRLLGTVERLGPASLRVTCAVALAAGAVAAVAAAGRAPVATAGVLATAALCAAVDAVNVASRDRRTLSDESPVRRSTVGQCPTIPERALPARAT